MIRWCVAEQADYSTYSHGLSIIHDIALYLAIANAIATDIPTCMPYEGRLRLHYDSVYMYDSASLYAQLAGLLCHDPANTAAVD